MSIIFHYPYQYLQDRCQFVYWRETLLSEEGTTQGDPLAMPMYALGVVPLVNTLSDDFVKQVWDADDATACDD